MQFEGIIVSLDDRSQYKDDLYRVTIKVSELSSLSNTFTVCLADPPALGSEVIVNLEFSPGARCDDSASVRGSSLDSSLDRLVDNKDRLCAASRSLSAVVEREVTNESV